MDNFETIQLLINQLNQYRDAYYNNATSEVSDAEYDRLFDKLVDLEKETGIVFANSPTQTVGYEVKSSLQKVEHPIPLLSLAKTKDVRELKEFCKDKQCLLMLKYDGLTVEVIYENGKLVQASTRGDGNIGEDITHNALMFFGVPQYIGYDKPLRVVGEAVILKTDFEKINASLEADEKPYANPRNLASGSVRQLDSAVCAKRNVRFYPWDVLEGFEEDKARSVKLSRLATFGFYPPIYRHYSSSDGIVNLERHIKEFRQCAEDYAIPIDGLVMKFNDIAYSKSLGGTSHHNNDGLAFKFEDETAESRLINIEWSLGRSGQLTPVAIFDPVELEGTTVERASLHNISIVRNLLGENPYVRQKVKVFKANAIIPQILEAEKDSLPTGYHHELHIPSECPVCGGETVVKIENNTEVLYCVNENCQGKLLGKLSHFVSKSAMNIEGLSRATLEKFIENGWLRSFADIYRLHHYKDAIISMDGFGKKSYENLQNSIKQSKTTTLDRVLNAISIPNIGKTASKELSKLCEGRKEKFLECLREHYDFTQLTDFGQIMSDSIREYFSNHESMSNFIDLLDYLDLAKQESAEIAENPMRDKTVVVTGSLVHFTRDSITEHLTNLGAKVASSVSKKTDYLIAGEKAGSKLKKAQEFGVQILTEEEFLTMTNK